MTVDVTVEKVGARGDGIARHGGRTLYVPLTAPGDRVRVRLGPARGEGVQAELVELLGAGPGRGVPPCRHFGRCGGCALQHLDGALYAETKRMIDNGVRAVWIPSAALPGGVSPAHPAFAHLLLEPLPFRLLGELVLLARIAVLPAGPPTFVAARRRIGRRHQRAVLLQRRD